jgi:aerobic carbon-monoxide dehydrogenase large subunit
VASRLTGQSIERVEDARLLTGQGRFVGGFDRAGLLHAAFVRSPVAHARLVSIDASRARQAPGVVAVFDGDDIAATMTGPMAVMGPPALKIAPYWPLARGKVRVVGDPVAIVVADSKARAVDAANMVEVQYDALAPVITFDQARDPSCPALWDETGTNVIYEDNTTYGRPFAEVAAGAAHLVRRRYTQHRYAHVPIEGRGAIADYSKFA